MKQDEDLIKCRHCEFESGVAGLKSHYILTHYREALLKYCQQQELMTEELSCKYCFITFNDDQTLVEHYGQQHNLVYKFIANFQGRRMSAEVNAEAAKTLSFSSKDITSTNKKSISVKRKQDQESVTETLFVDTAAPSTPVKIVSPNKIIRAASQPASSKKTSKASGQPPASPRNKIIKASQNQKPFKLPNHSYFHSFATFCISDKSHPEVSSIIQSNFSKFSIVVFQQFLDHFSSDNKNILQVEDLISQFSKVYTKEEVQTLRFVFKYKALRDYFRFCESMSVAPEECNQIQVVIFLSQAMTNPRLEKEDITWLVDKINTLHVKIEGRDLVQDPQIRGFCQAIGCTLPEPEKKTDDVEKQSEASNNHDKEEMATLQESVIVEDDGPAVVVEQDNIVETFNVKQEEVMQPVKNTTVTLSEEPELIELDDDDEDVSYHFVCEECDDCVGEGCDHTQHPRVLLPYNVSAHYKSTGHVSVQPLTGFLKMRPLVDAAYSRRVGSSVRKQWREMVLSGEL